MLWSKNGKILFLFLTSHVSFKGLYSCRVCINCCFTKMILSNRLQHCCFRFFQFVMTFPHSFSLLLASFRIISFSECHSEKAEWERESWMINLKSRAHIYSIFLWEGGLSAQLLDMLSEMVLSETRLQLKLLVYWNVWLVNGPLVFDGACNASWSKLEFFEA